MDKDKARVIQLLGDVLVKVILAIVAALILIVCTIALILDPSWPIALVEGVFAGTVTVVYKHYFPASATSSVSGCDSDA